MSDFEQKLLRLKEVLNLKTDTDVARIIGLSVRAFISRKHRDAFPMDKVLVLKAKRPDLDIDDGYIETGIPREIFEAHRSGKQAATTPYRPNSFDLSNAFIMGFHESQGGAAEIQDVKKPYAVANVSPKMKKAARRELEVLTHFRDATEEGKAAIEATAKAVEKIKKRK
jgi:hypothetical protein